NASEAAFPIDLRWGPQFDVVYVRWMVEYYRQTGDARWYELAYRNAKRALASGDERGFFTQSWGGVWLADRLEARASPLQAPAGRRRAPDAAPRARLRPAARTPSSRRRSASRSAARARAGRAIPTSSRSTRARARRAGGGRRGSTRRARRAGRGRGRRRPRSA